MGFTDFMKELLGIDAGKGGTKSKSTSRSAKGASSKAGRAKRKSSAPKSVRRTSSSKAKKSKGSDVRKIYKTTDGYFTGNDKIKKPRRVAVIHQRKDDKALAVAKIYSKKGKEGKEGYIPGLTLTPQNHSSLAEDSIVGKQLHIGNKGVDNIYNPIFPRDLISTEDKLTKKEHRTISKKAGGTTRKNRATNKRKIKAWKKHFRK